MQTKSFSEPGGHKAGPFFSVFCSVKQTRECDSLWIRPEMPRLKNCWACDISSGSRTFKGGGGTKSAEGASFLGGLGACPPPQKFSKMWVSKMTISSILRQISHSFNTTHNALLVNFVSVKKKKKIQIRGGGGTKAGLRRVNRTFGRVSVWKSAEACDTRSRRVPW